MKTCYYLIFMIILTFESDLFTQDSSFCCPQNLIIGVGFEAMQPTFGSNIFLYYKRMSLSITYGFPSSTNSERGLIKDIDYSINYRFSFAPMFAYNDRAMIAISLGLGRLYIKEKNRVLNYSGSGSISSTQYFMSIRFLPVKNKWYGWFGPNIEFGFNDWNYNDSVLEKSNAEEKYDYRKFYILFGLNIYVSEIF